MTRVAYGVQYVRDGKVQIARASKEVILSAGSVGSPQVLMLSGIGPREHLAQLQIPVIQDLRVGHNLQDHIGLGGFAFHVNQDISLVQQRYENVPSVLKYAMLGDGPLTVLGGVEGLGFVKTKYANASIDLPDIEFHFVSGSTASDGGTQIWKAHGIKESFYKRVFEPIVNKDVWSVIPMLLRPNSRGIIKLRSSNPYDYPLIYPNYLTDPLDVATLIEGVKIGVALSRTKSFQRLPCLESSKFF